MIVKLKLISLAHRWGWTRSTGTPYTELTQTGLAMLISADVRLSFSRALVYLTYRDKLTAVVPFLHNVRGIEVKLRREENGRIYLINEWHGGGEIPAAARAIISEAMLSWTDFATWNDAEFATDWRIETHAFKEAVHCAGKNRFLADGDGTLIQCRGELIIDPHQIHGVPSMVAGMVGGIVENFLSQKIGPNLQQTGEGVQHYLENNVVDRG
jgi:hypothetical protein